MSKTEMTKTELAIREQLREQLRDRFAAAALTGMLSNGYGGEYDSLAYYAYAYADAMLRQRGENA